MGKVINDGNPLRKFSILDMVRIVKMSREAPYNELTPVNLVKFYKIWYPEKSAVEQLDNISKALK